MKRKYTTSRDGVPRTNVNLTIRLTRDEYERIARIAKGRTTSGLSVASYLGGKMTDVIYATLDEAAAEAAEGDD